jgi:hypothetical protein
VSAPADDHEHVAANRQHLQLTIRLLRLQHRRGEQRGGGHHRSQPETDDKGGESARHHWLGDQLEEGVSLGMSFTFCRYSG